MTKSNKHRKNIFARRGFYGFLSIVFTLLLAGLLALSLLLPGRAQGNAVFAAGERPQMTEGFAAGEMPQRPEGFSGAEVPQRPEGFSAEPSGALSWLALIRRSALPLALLLGALDIFSLTMYISLRRRDKKSAAEAAEDEDELPRKKKKSFFPYLVMLAVALVLIIKQGSAQDTLSTDDIQVEEKVISSAAEKAVLTESLISGGPLSETSSRLYSLAGDIELTALYVANGDFVEAGQPIAGVDKASVEIAIAELSELMETLDTAIEARRTDAIQNSIISPTRGRIKTVYVSQGDRIEDVMAEHGALLRLSLDGLMAVDLEVELEPGTPLIARLSDGTELEARVSYRAEGKSTVTMSDELAPYGDKVAVFSAEGSLLGEGELYIHREMRITGFTGTVYEVYAAEGSMAEYEQTFMTLTDTGYSGERDRLIKKRGELEAQMNELFRVLESGCITAPCSGRISYINEDALKESSTLSFRDGGVGFFSISRLFDGGDEESPEKRLGEISRLDHEKDQVEITLSDGSLESIPVIYMNSSFSLGDMVRLSYEDEKLVKVEVFRALGDEEDSEGGAAPGGSSSVGSASSGGGGASASRVSVSGSSPAYSAYQGMKTAEEKDPYAPEETAICVITPYERISVEFSVSELDVSRLRVGQQAQITLDALPGQSFEGTISAVDPNGENEGGYSFYTVYADMERSADMLSGMNASIRLDTGEHEGLCIPVSALNESEAGTGVYTSYDSETDTLGGERFVETGFSDGERVIILSGLEEGEEVFYRYADSIKYSFSR